MGGQHGYVQASFAWNDCCSKLMNEGLRGCLHHEP